MTHPVCIFEDSHYPQLYPLTLTRPVFDLKCGIFSLKEKLLHSFSSHPVVLLCRESLSRLVREQNPDTTVNTVRAESCLFINGRLLAGAGLKQTLSVSSETVFFSEEQIVAAFLRKENVKAFSDFLRGDAARLPDVAKRHLSKSTLIRYPWDLVNKNASEIKNDFERLNSGAQLHGKVSERAVLLHDTQIHVGRESEIGPGVVLDATKGPIHIGARVTVMPNAVLEGPVFIGDGSTIKIGAKIYEGTSIGEVCKVGGEVEESIIHSYSNKQHDGFLGHSYLGQWVNLGADTNNSDLKNNYGSVKVWVNGELVDSRSPFAGLFMGDHSKTGINTMFNTGTSVGVMCNVFGAGFPPKFMPSFSWGGSDGLAEYDVQKALAMARIVMRRRGIDLTEAYGQMLKHIFEEKQNNPAV